MTMHVELVSPERILYSGDAEMVICRTIDGGEIAFLTGHTPFLGALAVAPVRIKTTGGDWEQAAVHGGFYLSPRVATAVVRAYLTGSTLPLDPLTSREREVVQRIAEGQTTKEIAAHLGLSVKTVESHRINLMRKLDIHETATLVRYAIRRGLTAP